MTGLDCIHMKRFVRVWRLDITFLHLVLHVTIVLASFSTAILNFGGEGEWSTEISETK